MNWPPSPGGDSVESLALDRSAADFSAAGTIAAAAGVGSTLGFTPDVNGAYTIQLDVGGDTTNANCVVSASTSASSSFTFQGYNFQGVTPCF